METVSETDHSDIRDEHHQTHNQTIVNSALIDACRLGDLKQVKYMLSHDHANVNLRCQSDRTPAMIAAVAGHRELLELLVEKGADLSLLDDEDNNILHIACMEGNLEIVKYIHSQKIIDINSRGGNGTTPLMSAAMFGKKHMFLFLMGNKANISKEDDDGKNILHLACQGGNVDIVKCVLTLNALYINSKDNNGITPLMLAAGYGNKVVFDFLIERGADILAKDTTNRYVLHWACQGGNVKIVKDILTQHIVDIDSKDVRKMTPLLLAAYHGKREVLELLIEKGANTSAVNRKGRNSLHLSCTRGHVDTVKYVLNQTSLSIDSKDSDEMTPLMLAAYHGNNEVLYILVTNGADPSVIGDGGDNVLHLACRGGNVEMVNYILVQSTLDINSKDADRTTPLMFAASNGKNELFEILMKKGADLSAIDYDGINILHYACQGGNVEIVNYILRESTLDINSKDDDGTTPLMFAASNGKNEVFDMLVKKGADLSVIENKGDNILHLACRGGSVKIVDYILIQSTLDINCKGFIEQTPLMYAASNGKNEIFDLLMKKGADLSVRNRYDVNILHFACEGGNAEIVNYILRESTLDINSKDDDGTTPLMFAADSGNNEVFDILMKKGADLSLTNEEGDNILHFASKSDNVKIVNYVLMQNLVDINSKNSHEKTPVVIAYDGEGEVFHTLVKNGADLSGLPKE